MVLIIRTQLWLTNYPQLGGGGLHIAHLLWGGLFMAITIGLLLVYINRSVLTPAAILGGIGFGFFIDELGKFITEDNDYFFRPAAALIYVIFVGIFLFIRWFERQRGLSPEEALANAIYILSGAATGDLNEHDRQRALALLDSVGEDTALVDNTRALLREVQALPAPEPGWKDRLVEQVRERYLALIERPRFNRLICWVVGVWGVLTMIGTFLLVLSLVPGVDLNGEEVRELNFVNWASLFSSATSAVLVLFGIRRLMTGDRAGAYRLFERAFLVAIFVTSVCSFYESQFGAVFGLAVNILLLVTFNRMASAEESGAARKAAESQTAVTAG